MSALTAGLPDQLTEEKSRSRAVKMRIGSPCRTRTVGPRWPSCWAAVAAAEELAPPISTPAAPPVASEPTPHKRQQQILQCIVGFPQFTRITVVDVLPLFRLAHPAFPTRREDPVVQLLHLVSQPKF